MPTYYRIALANIRFPETPTESVHLARSAVAEASRAGAGIVCFPECFIPGYRTGRRSLAPPNAAFLEGAWSAVAEAASQSRIVVVLGTERIVAGTLVASSIVIDSDGTTAGFQDKVQIDPSEEGTYAPGTERRVFAADAITFGIVICHEGWRYPETVRWAARRGASVVFDACARESGQRPNRALQQTIALPRHPRDDFFGFAARRGRPPLRPSGRVARAFASLRA